MRTLRLYVGEGFWSTRFIRDLLDSNVIEGATIIPAKGYWTDPEGKLFVEAAEVLVLTYSESGDPSWRRLVSDAVIHMSDHTNEQAIMVELADGSVSFYDRLDS